MLRQVMTGSFAPPLIASEVKVKVYDSSILLISSHNLNRPAQSIEIEPAVAAILSVTVRVEGREKPI
jgi:hypothetical protein